ncbi:MAG: GTPase family protein [Gemmataceae bacterium]
MSRRRILLVAVLALAPFLFLMLVGSYHLYQTGWAFIAWWPMLASGSLASWLGYRWTRRRANKLLPTGSIETPPNYWTERDQAAWAIVTNRAHKPERLTTAEMTDAARYSRETLELAEAIARIYHPDGTDPFGHLTLPEILACGELALRDLSRKVNQYVPGSHLLTINDVRKARSFVDYGQQAWQLSWLARMIWDPLQGGTQFLAAQAGNKPLDRIQDNVLLWFYAAYIQEVGRYLIELNSGRLKVGADRYRELTTARNATTGASTTDPATTTATTVPLPVTVALVGQVKAGKSSLVNALLGEQRAQTDVLPVTPAGTTYELNQAGSPRLTLIDTAGYGQAGPTEAEFAAALAAAEKADAIVLVSPARSAARQADVLLLDRLAGVYGQKPNLKLPPVIVALSQFDLLSPAAEWAPPYDWRTGARPKEVSIRGAIEAAGEDFGLRVRGLAPVTTAPGKIVGVRDDLLGVLADVLEDARGAGLLRALHAEAEAKKTRRVLDQLWNVGKEVLNQMVNERKG